MTKAIDTKALKRDRTKTLEEFLEQIKNDGTWRQWLNSSKELHITNVCRHLGKAEEKGDAWDATCFRGAYWAAPHKEEFNRWVKRRMEEELDAQDTDLFGNPLRTTVVLPPGLTFDGVPGQMVDFINDKLAEAKRLKEKVAALESHLNVKDRKVLELQTQMDSIIEAEQARDDHYLFSIRSLKYD